MTYRWCKEAIAKWCRENPTEVSAEFDPPLTSVQLQQAADPANWKLHGDIEEMEEALCFDCEPLDDQLRAYVEVDRNGGILCLTVQGE